MNEAKTEKDNENLSELEKSLTQLLIHYSKRINASEPDFIKFPDDSESEESNGSVDESPADSSCGGDDDEIITIENYNDDKCVIMMSENDESDNNFTKTLNVHSSQFEELLMGNLLSSGTKGSDLQDPQSYFQMSAPFKLRGNKGLLHCSLCQWSPPGSSFESFLTHCKTAAHRAKLKERFLKELSEDENEAKVSKQTLVTPAEVASTSSKSKSVPQKLQTAVQQEVSKKQNKVQFQKNPKGEQKKPTTEKNAKTEKIKKENIQTHKAPNNKPKPEEKISAKEIRDLKVIALAKGMACILPLPNNTLKCTMCNKSIPKAPEVSILMKNVSSHLQSKGHLNKLLKHSSNLENSLKLSQEKNPDEENFSKTAKPQGKTTTQEQITPNRKKTQVEIKKKDSTEKQKRTKKDIQSLKYQEKTSASNLVVFCLPCNYLNGNIEKFKTHLKSQTHLDCFASKGVSSDLSMDNLTKCNNCGFFLYGSLIDINKHNSKCEKAKAKS